MNFSFFDATNGKAKDCSWIKANISRGRQSLLYSDTSPWVTMSEIGCADSHRRLANKLLDSEDDAYLVLEDDVIPDKVFFNGISLGDCLKEHDLVLLGHSLIGKRFPEKLRTLNNRYSIMRYPDEGCLLACAYLMNKSAARIIVDHQYPKIRDGADHWNNIFYSHEDRCAIVWPRAVSTGFFKSTIRDQSYFRKKVIGLLQLRPLAKLYSFIQKNRK